MSISQIFDNLKSSLISNEDDQPFQFAIDEQELPQVEYRPTRKQVKTEF